MADMVVVCQGCKKELVLPATEKAQFNIGTKLDLMVSTCCGADLVVTQFTRDKFVKCPECDRWIDHLIEHQQVYRTWKMVSHGGDFDRIDLDDIEEIGDDDETYWTCPECEGLVAEDNDESKAESILKGEYTND